MQSRQKRRFILVSIVPPSCPRKQAEEELEELKSLVDTYGGADVIEIIQRRSHPDGKTYVGSGKAQAIAHLVGRKRIDVVVINAIVNPTQLFNIQKLCWTANPLIEIWDRADLILHIFQNHARTAEAKLQIELARMRHMGPRIYGLGMSFSQQAGGIGTRGLGETNVELMKRHWRDEMRRVRDRLESMAQNRRRQLGRRRDLGLRTVSIVGYTNAGKTTLFNLLTGKDKLSRDILFATLESTVGRLYDPDKGNRILVSDTIGFIQNLPPSLIDAFKSTLMESMHADLLLHVIDASDPRMDDKIAVVERILADLKLQEKKKFYVFNKSDLVDEERLSFITKKYSSFSPKFISVIEGTGIKNLYHEIRAAAAGN
jgi:GTP-binding protein HflX